MCMVCFKPLGVSQQKRVGRVAAHVQMSAQSCSSAFFSGVFICNLDSRKQFLPGQDKSHGVENDYVLHLLNLTLTLEYEKGPVFYQFKAFFTL